MERNIEVKGLDNLRNGSDLEANLANNEQDLTKDMEKQEANRRKKALGLSYLVDEVPPWYLAVVLGFQHYLTMFGATVAIPFILAKPMCYAGNSLALSELISTIFFVSGISTLIQSIFGVRLPIVQGGTFSFLSPTFAILSLQKWQCPSVPQPVNGTMNNTVDLDVWKPRMREIQGAVMVASLFQTILGFSGVVGFLLQFIGPLAVMPTITLVGLALFGAAADFSGNQWGIAWLTIVLITMFSQYMKNIKIRRFPIFRLFPIILAIILSWIVCAIVTAAGGFSSNPANPSFKARTDARIGVLREAKWFRFPYPGQWGTPTVSAAGVFGMLAGVLASMIESVGDYYACARLSGAPPPPKHAINRGIGIEGIGCLLAGAWGSGNGTTSYSENIGAIGITKVGSRRVVQFGALVMLLFGVLGKFGALFTTIPEPIVGGVFMVMFGMITAVGISNLQFVDMNSPRNLFIIGFSLILGMALPYWMNKHPDAIQTGVIEIDQIITVLFKTNMFVGGVVGFVLDNTMPGTPDERGIRKWRQTMQDSTGGNITTASIHIYDLPCFLHKLSYFKFAKYMPFLPYYNHSPVEPETNSNKSKNTTAL